MIDAVKSLNKVTINISIYVFITQMYDRLQAEARKIGLLVNVRKTKYMFMTEAGNMRKPHNLKIRNKEYEGVS